MQLLTTVIKKNQVQDTSNDTNNIDKSESNYPEDSEHNIPLPVTSHSEQDKDIQESAQGSKIGSNDESKMAQDTNSNPDSK